MITCIAMLNLSLFNLASLHELTTHAFYNEPQWRAMATRIQELMKNYKICYMALIFAAFSELSLVLACFGHWWILSWDCINQSFPQQSWYWHSYVLHYRTHPAKTGNFFWTKILPNCFAAGWIAGMDQFSIQCDYHVMMFSAVILYIGCAWV